jgi:hypothetical protein
MNVLTDKSPTSKSFHITQKLTSLLLILKSPLINLFTIKNTTHQYSFHMTTKRALLVCMKYNEPGMIDTHMDCSRFHDCIIKYCGFHKPNIYTILDNKDNNPNATISHAIVEQLRILTDITKSRDILLFWTWTYRSLWLSNSLWE